VPTSLTFFLNLLVIAPPIYELSGRWPESPLSFVVVLTHTASFVAFSGILLAHVRWRSKSAGETTPIW
jgi:hypothetical protein